MTDTWQIEDRCRTNGRQNDFGKNGLAIKGYYTCSILYI